jgi:site-specific DNA-methyltransferase (adenine-specific)
MQQKWDGGDIAFRMETWQDVLRVLKPGGYLLAFSSSRTYHRMAVAIEDAGFEIRDQIMWLYGSGFPKSLNITKHDDTLGDHWDGWGTALKPAHEPIVMARKPFVGNTTDTIKQYGTGGLNIDGCRIPAGQEYVDKCTSVPSSNERISARTQSVYGVYGGEYNGAHNLGRWPANVIHDGSDEVESQFAQYGESKAGVAVQRNRKGQAHNTILGPIKSLKGPDVGFGDTGTDVSVDTGTPSRFFYCAKASKKDREEGLEDMQIHSAGNVTGGRKEGSAGLKSPRAGAGRNSGGRNIHPTVKPTNLMRYLVRLVTPKNGIVLDLFMGSGSTGKAAILEGARFVGIEMMPDYYNIAQRRIENAAAQQHDMATESSPTLF